VNVGAVLVHIDLDGDRPHAASVSALAAGRAVASSWGATLYAALLAHASEPRGDADIPGEIVTTLAHAGADKIVVAMTDAPVAPTWGSSGAAWQRVFDQLRPRLVLFGEDAPSVSELAPRTSAQLEARLVQGARALDGDEIDLRDPDGAGVRVGDPGVTVVTIRGDHVAPRGDEDIDVVVLAAPGDPR